MINQRSIEAIQASRFSPDFLKPLYSTYSFAQIPQTILSLFGIGTSGLPKDCIIDGVYDRVVFILIDGFGWKFLEQYGEKYPFLKHFLQKGVASKLTSQFPSTTAAHITTFCTGQPVGEHGIYEWFLYEPTVNRVVAPLLYAFAGDKELGTLESSLKPADFLPQNQFFETLKQNNISSKVFQARSITDSIYSQRMFQGADRIGYKNFKEGLSLLKDHMKSPGFFYIYCGDFDAQAHRHGLESPQLQKALDHYFYELETFLRASSLKSTALIVAADHGMIDIHPKTTYYINEKIPTLEKRLKKGANGHVLSPAGSCRDFFLHIEPQYLKETKEELEDSLKEIALVRSAQDLIDEGFFGPAGISEKCRARMADLVLLTKGSNSIWWHEKGRFEQKLYAMHGGLTPDELETTFLFYTE
jgi:predicted AlkP superfamily pyrophosphatase or phosphodiesterase